MVINGVRPYPCCHLESLLVLSNMVTIATLSILIEVRPASCRCHANVIVNMVLKERVHFFELTFYCQFLLN